MFQLKDFATIVHGMINRSKATQDKITDFRVGAVIRTIFESPAAEIDELYQQMWIGVKEAIPVAIYNSFGFDYLPAMSAGGFVRFHRAPGNVAAISIPAGTALVRSDNGLGYKTLAAATLTAGSAYLDVRVVADAVGTTYNATLGAVDTLKAAINGIASVENTDRIIGGKEIETEDERKGRFALYIGSLSRGTVWSILYAASQCVITDDSGRVIEYISRVGISDGGGKVSVFIYGSGGAPSASLISEVTRKMSGYVENGVRYAGYQPAGTSLAVVPMTERKINVSLRVATSAGAVSQTLKTSISDQVASILASVQPGGSLVVAKISEWVLSLSGMTRCVVENIENPACGTYEVLGLGTLSVVLDA